MSEPATTATPIADLSYRGYDGPLETRALRWWTVSLATIRLSKRKVWFWIWAVISSLSYLFAILGLFIQSNFQAQMQQGMSQGGARASWSSYFVDALPWSMFFLIAVTMVVGASSIAGDNRANALLVYLSKPLTKQDYLVGKWVGIFVLLLAVASLPALVLYLYCLLSFRAEGFFSSDRLLLGKVLLVCLVGAAIHCSLILGFSAWSKRPTMAGAMYAGFYFLGVAIARIAFRVMAHGDTPSRKAITISHMAIPGIVEGLAYHIYRENPGIRLLGRSVYSTPRPFLLPLLLAAVALVVIPILLARAKIHAVEVVRG